MPPFLSIIIPAFNAEGFIADCIRSILRQDFRDYEIIIVNDGSTDNTLKVCEAFKDKNNRIKIVDQQNMGVSCARNVGLTLASGQYIWFIDADDEITDFPIAKMVGKVRSLLYPDIIRYEYQAIDGQCKVLFKSKVGIRTKSDLEAMSPEDFFIKCVRQDFFLWLLWIKRETIADLRFTDGRIYMEDADFICRLAKCIKTSAYGHHIIYNYRKYPEAASSKLNYDKVNDIHLFIDYLCSIIKQNNSGWLISYYKTVCNRALLIILEFFNGLYTTDREELIEQLKTQSIIDKLLMTFHGKNAEWVKIDEEGWNLYFKRYGIRRRIRNFRNIFKSLIFRLST